MEFSHVSVMLNKAVDGLNVKADGFYVDCTTGGGGHSYEIASKLSQNGRLFCFDRDPEAIEAAKKRLDPFADRITFVNRNFCEVGEALEGIELDGAIIDLGVSSYQLDNAERGFSYMKNAPLDMRMNQNDPKNAYDVVNYYSKEELIAEIGAATLVNAAGLETSSSFRNSAAYVQNWLKVLKDDKRFIVSAAGKAEKAVNLILGAEG